MNTDREAFDEAVKNLRGEVDNFRKEAETKLNEAINQNCAQLIEQLLPNVMPKPSERWRPFLDEDSSEDDFRQLLAEELNSAYGDASNHLGQIEVRDIYKNITVEMLHDQEFVAAALKVGLQLKGKSEEFDAVRTRG